MRILVAEDHNLNQRLVEAMLHELKHEFEIVENGALAVDAVAEKEFDIVLMDMRMPVMDGWEATEKIRGFDNDKSAIPIIALTADADDDENVSKFHAAGMTGALAKPFSFADLMRTLEEHSAS